MWALHVFVDFDGWVVGELATGMRRFSLAFHLGSEGGIRTSFGELMKQEEGDLGKDPKLATQV